MVAILSPGRYLRQAFHYNENKVKEGVAEILHAENYHRDTRSVSAYDRLHMLEKMAAINPRVKVNSLHISLNFDPSEQLPRDKMVIIAREYMEGLGFGNQPYLVYQHHDSGHPHLHILTTNVQLDGTPISFHHLANRKSEPTRKALEKKMDWWSPRVVGNVPSSGNLPIHTGRNTGKRKQKKRSDWC